jgi:hypothetical protein
MRQWIKAGGAAALVIAGIPVLIGSRVVGAVLIGLGLALGLALWLQESDRVPFRVVPKDRAAADNERRELLSLAQVVRTELETCRYRLVRAEKDHVGWDAERSLPAEAYNTRWAPALVTADQTVVNEALSGFYVWANEMNHHMSRVAAAEWNTVGAVASNELLLGAETVVPAREGISRVTNAQEQLDALIKRLAG